MTRRLKKIIIGALDVVLGAYILLAVTSFNKPKTGNIVCSKVEISVADSTDVGFLSADEIKNLLVSKGLYPLGKKMSDINPRNLEDAMAPRGGGGGLPFVKTAQCYKTENGHVCIVVTQRTPLIRIKSGNGADYYLDDQGGIMPNSKYTSNLIIATGSISDAFAKYYIAPMAKVIMADEFWNNMIEQINVLPDHGIELVPRVGGHIIYIGQLPTGKYRGQIANAVSSYVASKLDRTLKFYKYGLSKAGWNKYSYIDVELDNQIVCRRRSDEPTADEQGDKQQEAKAEETKKEEPAKEKRSSEDTLSRHELTE